MLVSRHHTIWQRRHYKTPVERAFREHEGLVIPMLDTVHHELHADLFPPPKPSRDTMIGAINNLEDHHLTHPLDGVLFTIEYLEGKDQRLADHLYRQLGYLMIGVERVEV